jgi:hypothetical protein
MFWKLVISALVLPASIGLTSAAAQASTNSKSSFLDETYNRTSENLATAQKSPQLIASYHNNCSYGSSKRHGGHGGHHNNSYGGGHGRHHNNSYGGGHGGHHNNRNGGGHGGHHNNSYGGGHGGHHNNSYGGGHDNNNYQNQGYYNKH